MKDDAIRLGTVLATALLCLWGVATGQTDGSLFVQGQIDMSATGLTVTTESDRRVFRIENPEILRSPEGHRVMLHGTLTKDGIRVISAATIEEGKYPFNTALCEMAAYRKDVAMVSHLLELGADPNAKTPNGSPALIEAIESGLMRWGRPPSLEITTLLLDHGADPNAMDKNWRTPLMAAAFTANDEVVKILIAHKANVNIGSRYGNTALMEARGLPVVKLLLSAGSVVNDKNINGRTALHWAAWRGDPEVVKVLIEAGANVNAKDDKGETALDLVKQQLRYAKSDTDRNRGDTKKIRFQNVADILLTSGAS
jgi:ankyrin repeat protein